MFTEKTLMGSFISRFRAILFPAFVCLAYFNTSGCGAGDGDLFASSEHVGVSVSPMQPLVISAPIAFYCPGIDTACASFEAPWTSFRLLIDNKEGDEAITIMAARINITGPKDPKVVYLTAGSMGLTNDDGDFIGIGGRSIIGTIGAGRKSSCMHKVDYLELPSTASSCPSDLDINPTNSDECCPGSLGNLANVWFYIGGIQDLSQDEIDDPASIYYVYQFEVMLQGWFGTLQNPKANFRKQIMFNSSGI